MKDIVETIIFMSYNLALIIGTVYLVQIHNWSMWTFLLTVCFLASKTKGSE